MNDAIILEARRLAQITQPRHESAKVWHLNDEHFCAVIEWKLAGFSAKKIGELCKTELTLPPAKIPGRQSLSIFWPEFAPFLQTASRRSAASLANQVATEAQQSPAQFDAATIDAIRQRVFELAMSPITDPRDVKALMGLILKKEQMEFDREKMRRDVQSKVEAGLDEIAKELGPDSELMTAIRAKLASKMAE